MESLFISVSQLKEITNIQNNVDTKIVANLIKDAQAFRLLPLLGDSLYNEIDHTIGTSGLTTNNKYLLDNYLINVIKFYVQAEFVLMGNYKLTNASIAEMTAINTSTVDSNQLFYLKGHYSKKMEFMEERAKNYLCKNINLFPLFQSSSNYDFQGNLKNTYNSTSGIYFKKK